MNTYKINPEIENLAIGVLIDRINKGYELQTIEHELKDEEILKYNGSIILAPEYQREYRFSIEDEIKLIESVLVGIPIPPIFLATDRYNNVRVTNVVDGQHRLRALYRFYNNEFKLNGLKLLNGLDGKSFNDLHIDTKSEFTEVTLLVTIFKDFPGTEFELEIFNRYNKGTKPLSPQEIRHAVYNSPFNTYINNFTFNLYNKKGQPELYHSYNITKDRIQKKKVQEGLFVILSILEYGINENYEKSLVYAENYMKEKADLDKSNPTQVQENFHLVKSIFEDFNKFIIKIHEVCEFPFSKELYGVSSRNYKFQISIAMILAGIFNKLYTDTELLNGIFESNDIRNAFLNTIRINLRESFLEDPDYNASTTNSREILKLIKNIFSDIDTSTQLLLSRNNK
ncbi:hypothetical protein QFZ31_002286 [Neobacillus niacini]|uniref:DUF262 domain-containing protein n=1 Tax=Neobacillus driksii TaxID=3035913 RepID=UPI00277FCC2A|nr:DUF262 domain-containing protein [Neobacillus niacini]MDQ0972408.1 hypothetical protein [Neobacillus niacini]